MLNGPVSLLDKYILLHFRNRLTSVFWLQAIITRSASRAEMSVLVDVNLNIFLKNSAFEKKISLITDGC